MSTHAIHDHHPHRHTAGCGHQSVIHDGHIDEHVLAISKENPAACTPAHACNGHEAGHRHGEDCGHQAIPHGDHVDYLAGGHLHFAHGSHCDDHGAVRFA